MTCEGVATAPHASGGTAQWELHIVCSAVGQLYAASNVYTLVGTGDRQKKVWQDRMGPLNRVSSWLDGYDATPCDGSGSMRWIADVYATYNGIAFNPYPAWSPVVTIPCTGMIKS